MLQQVTYTVSLTITSNGVCTDVYTQDITILGTPGTAEAPTGDDQLCQGSSATDYTTTGATDATSYAWEISPASAGTITGDALTASFVVDPTFTGTVGIMVKGINECGEGTFSIELPVTVLGILEAPATPEGPDTVDLKSITSSEYTTAGVNGADIYAWFLSRQKRVSLQGHRPRVPLHGKPLSAGLPRSP